MLNISIWIYNHCFINPFGLYLHHLKSNITNIVIAIEIANVIINNLETMCQNEANLKAVVVEVNAHIDVVNCEVDTCKKYLELINITGDQYNDALEKLATLSLVSLHLQELKKWVDSGDARMSENYMRFTLHQIEEFSHQNENRVVVLAKHRIRQIFQKCLYRQSQTNKM